MLFNSPIFLLVFLPITLAAFYLLGRLRGPAAAVWVLLVASLTFYAYSSLFNFALFSATVVANFLLGFAIARASWGARAWLICGIVLNLCLISTFKYSGLLVSGIDKLL